MFFPLILLYSIYSTYIQSPKPTFFSGYELYETNTTARHGKYRQFTSEYVNFPAPRGKGLCLTIPKYFLLYGGRSDVYNDDLWNDVFLYDRTRNRWAWVKGSSSANGISNGFIREYNDTNEVDAKSGMMGCVVNEDEVFMFGGSNGVLSDTNDGWMFNVNTYQWKFVTGSEQPRNITSDEMCVSEYGESYEENNYPAGRRLGVMLKINDNQAWLYGGMTKECDGNEGYLSEIWQFHFNNYTWKYIGGETDLDSIGVYNTEYKNIYNDVNHPHSRSDFTAAVINDHEILIFGGKGGAIQSNEVWKYDYVNNQWKWVSGTMSNIINTNNASLTYYNQNNVLKQRFGHSMIKISEKEIAVFFGNNNGNHRMQDMWLYEIELGLWKNVFPNINNSPPEFGTLMGSGNDTYMYYELGSRHHSFSWLNSDSKSIIIYGGRGIDGNDYVHFLHDVWEVNFTYCCDGHGSCNDRDGSGCECYSGYKGDNCEIPKCFGRYADDEYVCSGHGNCTALHTCVCEDNYSENKCHIWTCNGTMRNSSNTCNGNGVCSEHNICECYNNTISEEECVKDYCPSFSTCRCVHHYTDAWCVTEVYDSYMSNNLRGLITLLSLVCLSCCVLFVFLFLIPFCYKFLIKLNEKQKIEMEEFFKSI